ncbi:hypothetical protein IFR05_014266 [Cadophora sp. M221]|nr:hypothetical protein IFR05_014266 [Cadophora sp. M221]
METIKSASPGREVRCGIRKTILDDITLPLDVGMIEIHFSVKLDKLERLHVGGGLYGQNALYQLAVCTRPWGWEASHFCQIILGPKMHYILGSSTASWYIYSLRHVIQVAESVLALGTTFSEVITTLLSWSNKWLEFEEEDKNDIWPCSFGKLKPKPLAAVEEGYELATASYNRRN